jgi:hypothetical protein
MSGLWAGVLYALAGAARGQAGSRGGAMSETVFTRLCDVTDELQRLTRDLEHSPFKLAIERLMDRLDLISDDTVGIEIPSLEEDEAESATPDGRRP